MLCNLNDISIYVLFFQIPATYIIPSRLACWIGSCGVQEGMMRVVGRWTATLVHVYQEEHHSQVIRGDLRSYLLERTSVLLLVIAQGNQ